MKKGHATGMFCSTLPGLRFGGYQYKFDELESGDALYKCCYRIAGIYVAIRGRYDGGTRAAIGTCIRTAAAVDEVVAVPFTPSSNCTSI